MGDEKVTLCTIVNNIKWDTDGEDVELPKCMVIPEEIDDEAIGDYISDKTGFCHKSYQIGT